MACYWFLLVIYFLLNKNFIYELILFIFKKAYCILRSIIHYFYKYIHQEERKARQKKTMTKESQLLADDTDIFSDLPASTPKAKETKKKPKKAAAEKKSVFKDDVGESSLKIGN